VATNTTRLGIRRVQGTDLFKPYTVDLPSIVTLGGLSGPVLNIFTQVYTVTPFTGSLTPVTRKARITFGGQIFTVKQSSW